MIEVYKNFYVGAQDDYDSQVKMQSGWAVVHACKEPYHRQTLGYKGKGAPKDHPEYLFAVRGDRLILNLVDVADPAYISKQIIDEALNFIDKKLQENKKVLVHCNQGQSRSASIAMLYLAIFTDKFVDKSFESVETEFKKIYPSYLPANGMRVFMCQNWNSYLEQTK